MIKKLFLVIFISLSLKVIAQKEEEKSSFSGVPVLTEMKENKITWNTDPLSPARAAFYSAIFPGLGQIYNKSYWKLPLVYLAIGIPTYYYIANTKQFNRYQAAYKRRLAGFTDDEFYGNRSDGQPRFSTEGLQRAQQFYRRNQELSILFIAGLYALNIIDANVDAHLQQFNVDENLSLEPFFQQNEVNAAPQFGMTLRYRF